VKAGLERDLRCFGAFLHLTGGEQALEETLRNGSTYQMPSPYLIKVRGNSKFTFPGYMWVALEALKTLLNRQHLDKVSAFCDICHSVFLHLDGRGEVAQWTAFSLY